MSAYPLLVFVGTNLWEKRQALKALQEKEAFLQRRTFEIADQALPWEDLLQSLRTMPFGGRPPLLILRQVEKCPARFQELLVAALLGRAHQNRVVLDLEASPEGSFLEPVLSEATTRPFPPLRREELPGWLSRRAETRGKQILREASLDLLALGGEDLFFLDQAVEQLSVYVGKRETLTAEDVRRLIKPRLFQTGFELAKAVGRRQVPEALTLLSRLSPQEKLQALVGSMGWQLRRLRQAKGLIREGCSKEEISRRIGLRWEERGPFLEAAASLQEEEMDRVLERLLRLDVESKTGLSDETVSLETFILSLAQKGGEFSGET